MAIISSKTVFITTSPRSPIKMIPEIGLLDNNFSGKKWDIETQKKFMELLKSENFFKGEGKNDPAFSARDRINRAPKALGFVTLSPKISLTPAGNALIKSNRTEEIFLKQLLKFQLPSPYHVPNCEAAEFWVKPYLEIFRLIRHFGSLKFDELMIFGLQLVDYRIFDSIIEKIERFREAKAKHEGSYKVFRANYLESELRELFKNEILNGKTKTRENKATSIASFLRTKSNNLRDYTDACIRYLRATGLISISHYGKSISITSNNYSEVDYFLNTVDRDPCYVNEIEKYAEYLGSVEKPALLTDDIVFLENRIKSNFPDIEIIPNSSIENLRDIYHHELELRKNSLLSEQITSIKDYSLYDDINSTFQQIIDNSLYDAPLIMEWNTWRAMTMIDGGKINSSLKFDDFGMPMSTAIGNIADIVCDYQDFFLTVEVTLQSGQRQYETEGEPVTRHLAKVKKATQKPAYCLFIAPKINEACIAHFYALQKMDISYYGGKSNIVPLPLRIFQKMVDDSFQASFVPQPKHIKHFFEKSSILAEKCKNEVEWYQKITEEALNWLKL